MLTDAVFCALGSEYDGSLYVDVAKSKKVSRIEYGFHYEEIGMMGAGGLYAEMVRNRCLEEANSPKGLKAANGLYTNVSYPHGKNKTVYSIDPLIGWSAVPAANSPISLA